MFKNIKSFFAKEAPKAVPKSAPEAGNKAAQSAPASRPVVPPPLEVPAPAAKPKPPVRTPEEICEITSKMPKEEIRQRLALLYRRYNRATSSLDGQLRGEAEKMLDAIVAVREKVFGPI